MYLGRFVRAALDTHKILSGYTADTSYIKDTYLGLVLFALLSKELKALRLFARVRLHLGLALKGWHRCLSIVPHEPRLLQRIRLNLLELVGYIRTHVGYIRDTRGIHARYIWDTCICSGSRTHGGYMRDT